MWIKTNTPFTKAQKDKISRSKSSKKYIRTLRKKKTAFKILLKGRLKDLNKYKDTNFSNRKIQRLNDLILPQLI